MFINRHISVVCCDRVMIENLGGQGGVMGVYIKMTDATQNDRPVYARSDNSQYLWNRGVDYGWAVGEDYVHASTGISVKNEVRISVYYYLFLCMLSMGITALKMVLAGNTGTVMNGKMIAKQMSDVLTVTSFQLGMSVVSYI